MWRLGRLLKSLNYLVEKDLQETVQKNAHYRLNRWSYIERQIITWASSPGRYMVSLFVFMVLFAGALIALSPYVQLYPAGSNGWTYLSSWQSVFLGGQLTILGVILPISIGLISLVLAQKSAANAIWSIYYSYSGYLFVVLSGVGLALEITLSLYLIPIIPGHWYVAISVVNGFWFAFNISLTCWFFWSTATIVREKSRTKLLHRFSSNEAYVQSIRSRLSSNIPMNAFEIGLLKRPSESAAYISTYKYGAGNFQPLAREFASPRRITNIRFSLLGLALNLWLKYGDTVQDGKPSIVFPVTSKTSGAEVALAQYENIQLPWYVKYLIILSYSFGKMDQTHESEVHDVVVALVGAAEDAIKEDNERRFTSSISELKEWHANTIDQFAFVNDNGGHDNWMLLQDVSLWASNYNDDISREYYQLARQAVNKIPVSTRFFSSYCHLHQGIFSRIQSVCPIKLANELLKGSHRSWDVLMNWSGFIEKPDGSSINYQYSSAVMDFVGSWESWSYHLNFRGDDRFTESETIELLSMHLSLTARMVISALRIGDVLAANWAVDMLCRWHSNMITRQHEFNEYRWNTELLTFKDVQEQRGDDFWAIIFNQDEFSSRAATNISFSNAVTDVRITTACYLLSKTKESVPSEVEKLVAGLIRGAKLDFSENLGPESQLPGKPVDILTSYIRQRGFRDEGEYTYGSWIDSILDAFNSIEEPPRVSGRVYSMGGIRDVRGQLNSFVELAVRQSRRMWGISPNLQAGLDSRLFEQRHLDLLIADLNSWETAIKENYLDVLPEEDPTRVLASNCHESVSKIRQSLADKVQQNIAAAAEDEERIEHIGKCLSSRAFNKDLTDIPFRLFQEVGSDCPISDEYKKIVNLQNFQKREIAAGIQVNRAINEDEWFEELMLSQNQAGILSECFESMLADPIEKQVGTAAEFLARITEDAGALEEQGFAPAIFIASTSVYRTLHTATYDQSQLTNYEIKIKQGFGDSYLCHLNGVEVYDITRTRIEKNILFTKEIFSAIQYGELDDGSFVRLKFLPEEGNPVTGTLRIEYWRKIEFEKGRVLTYGLNPEAEVT